MQIEEHKERGWLERGKQASSQHIAVFSHHLRTQRPVTMLAALAPTNKRRRCQPIYNAKRR